MSAAPLLRPSALARFWELHPRTVVAWIREGKLVAIQTPGAQYRLRASDVRDFCARASLPTPPFARDEATRIVLAGITSSARRSIERALEAERVSIEAYAGALEGIVAAACDPPSVVALDASSREVDADAAVRALRRVPELARAIVIAFDAPTTARADALVRAGATRAIVKNVKNAARAKNKSEALVTAIRDALA